ncbi:MAG TPA: hypothetical protein VK864_07935, partial [Longimicrobiales bacterium]|nr:hypothetical protein [Longimicrobiales bacterium]
LHNTVALAGLQREACDRWESAYTIPNSPIPLQTGMEQKVAKIAKKQGKNGLTFPTNCGRGRESIMLSKGVAHAQKVIQSGVQGVGGQVGV